MTDLLCRRTGLSRTRRAVHRRRARGAGRGRLGAALGLALAALLPEAGAAGPPGPPELAFPLDCTLGETCLLQQYVDRDPGEGWTDHRCGPRSYDGHKGTDIMLPSRAAMRDGVDILAAAPGVVARLRDGMPDIPRDDPAAPELAGRDCGNGVMLRHAGGWTTQYCHMAEGSVRVDEGDRVARGAVLGRVGLSGNAVVPHLHLAVRDPGGGIVDPFDARPMDAPCGAAPGGSLWADPLHLAYRAGGAVSAGLLPAMPDYDAVKESAPHEDRIARDAPALVFWAMFFGMAEGDRIVLRLTGPGGRALARDAAAMARDRAMEFRAVGRRADGQWPPGRYRGEAALVRDGTVVDRVSAATTVR